MSIVIHTSALKNIPEKGPYTPSQNQYIWLSQHVSKKAYVQLLEEGLRHYPFNRQLTKKLNDHYEQTIFSIGHFRKLAKNLLKNPPKNTAVFYKQCTNHLYKSENLNEALKILEIGFYSNDMNKNYINFVIKFAKKTMNWQLAIRGYEKLLLIEETASNLYDLAVFYEITGRLELAAPLFEKVQQHYSEDYENLFEDYYRKYTLFNNGSSKIEYYKNIMPNNEVVATYDTITKTWNQIPFAYNAIKKRGKDIIALRRNSVRNFHQDISREEYWEATKFLFENKEKKYAYGTSLGGYCALYFGSLIPEVKILAMAPRNSAHPSYGSSAISSSFQHISPHPKSEHLNAIIMYDDKNIIDQRYLSLEVLPSYPTAKVMTIPYAGHRLPKFLTQSGQLKSIVNNFFNDKVISPIKRGKLRYHSSEYFWVIAEKCLAHHHYSWAVNYSNHAIQLEEKFDRPYLIKINALIELKQFSEAMICAQRACELFDKQSKFIILLAETYILIGEKETAITFIEQQLLNNTDTKLNEYLLSIQ